MLFGKPLRRWTLSTAPLASRCDGLLMVSPRRGGSASAPGSTCTAGRVTLFGLNRGDYRISPLIVG